MHITLIRPRLGHVANNGYRSPASLEPLALGILKALTPSHIKVTTIDERLEPVDFAEPTDLVALSVCTFSAKRAYEIAAAYKKLQPKVLVVLGGFHPTLVPDEAAEHADAVACGDAEPIWAEILDDAAKGKLKPRYQAERLGPQQGISPDRSAFAGKRYAPVNVVQYGRGCPHRCEFCSIRAFYKGRICYRDPRDVAEEIRKNRLKRLFIADDNIMASKKKFVELLELITPLGIKWTSQIDLRFADDPKLIAMAKRSGCQGLIIGLESLNRSNLEQMNKSWNPLEQYRERLGRLRQAGIMVWGTFVIGYDDDGPDVFARTVDFAIRERLFIANFNPLQALPGTPLYDRLLREGRLVSERWWLDPNYRWHDATVIPRGMSPENLTNGCAAARAEFNTLGSSARRFFGGHANRCNLNNAMIFLLSNFFSWLDIRAKSGMKLGGPKSNSVRLGRVA